MIKVSQLEGGTIVTVEGKYLRVQKTALSHVGRGKATCEVNFRDIVTGQPLNRNFKSDDELEEAEVERQQLRYAYRKGEILFLFDPKNQKLEFANPLGKRADFMKKDMKVDGVFIDEKLIAIELPIKATYEVVEAPPGTKGNTAQGGTKVVKLDSGAEVKTPLFVNQGDQIIVNTETGEYVSRA